jgi:predicted N-formylglutamate amidohydrolase
MNEMSDSLLAADEPAPVTVHNENGLSPFLIVADHVGNFMPRALRGLGVGLQRQRRPRFRLHHPASRRSR